LPLFENDNEAAAFLTQVYQCADALLFGRRTYEIFAGSWGSNGRFGQPDRGGAERAAQVRRIDHAHRPAVGGHDPSCPVTSRPPSAS
jgi:hypothetical protein